jgi:hypothetical protein
MTWEIPDNVMSRYLSAVKDIISNENSFLNFRRNHQYGGVVGAVTNLVNRRDYTAQLFNWATENYPNIDFESLKVFDSVGNPYLEKFAFEDSVINISASTLRYLYPALRIKEEFGLENPINVVELGIGYGGMAAIMHHFFNIKSYELLDLPEVQTLANKYLTAVGIKVTDKIEKEPVDLFISEYCLSEFDDGQIKTFYDMHIRDVKYFYIASNLTKEETRRKGLRDLLETRHDLKILEVFPYDPHPVDIIYGVKK